MSATASSVVVLAERPPRVSSKAALSIQTLGYPAKVRRVGIGGRKFSALKHYSGAFGSPTKARVGYAQEKAPGLTQRPRAPTGTFANQAAQGMGTVQLASLDVGSRWGGRKLRQEAASRRVAWSAS
jgi:hypothetical protein